MTVKIKVLVRRFEDDGRNLPKVFHLFDETAEGQLERRRRLRQGINHLLKSSAAVLDRLSQCSKVTDAKIPNSQGCHVLTQPPQRRHRISGDACPILDPNLGRLQLLKILSSAPLVFKQGLQRPLTRWVDAKQARKEIPLSDRRGTLLDS